MIYLVTAMFSDSTSMPTFVLLQTVHILELSQYTDTRCVAMFKLYWLRLPVIKISIIISDLVCRGKDNGCCTKENPCFEGDGDCDYDNQCYGDLKCGKQNCAKKYGGFWDQNDDCCYRPYGLISDVYYDQRKPNFVMKRGNLVVSYWYFITN